LYQQIETMNNNQTETSVQGTEGLNELFTTYFNEVVQSYPSIFTKDDVILFLNRIQKEVTEVTKSVPTNEGKSQEQILDIVQEFLEDIDIDQYSDIELSGRELSIDFYHRDLFRDLKDVVESKL